MKATLETSCSVRSSHAGWTACGKCQAPLASDNEYQVLLAASDGFAQRMERDLVVGVAL